MCFMVIVRILQMKSIFAIYLLVAFELQQAISYSFHRDFFYFRRKFLTFLGSGCLYLDAAMGNNSRYMNIVKS